MMQRIRQTVGAIVAAALLLATAYVPPAQASGDDSIIVFDGNREWSHWAQSAGDLSIAVQGDGDSGFLPDGEAFGSTASYLFQTARKVDSSDDYGMAYVNFHNSGQGYNLGSLYNTGKLQFRVKGADGGESFTVKFFKDGWESEAVPVTASDDWEQISVPLKSFADSGNMGMLSGVTLSFGIFDNLEKTFSITDIRISATALPPIAISGNSGSWSGGNLSLEMTTVTESAYDVIGFNVSEGSSDSWGAWNGTWAVDSWQPTDIGDYWEEGSLEFYAKGAVGGESFNVVLMGDGHSDNDPNLTAASGVHLQSDQWHKIRLPLALFDIGTLKTDTFMRLQFANQHGDPLQFWLHSIQIVATSLDETIVSVSPVSRNTVYGTAPDLPAVVQVTHEDQSTSEAAVQWQSFDAHRVGKFVVEGVVAGTDLRAQANINIIYPLFKGLAVSPPSGGSGENLYLNVEDDDSLPIDGTELYNGGSSIKLQVSPRQGEAWGWWYVQFPLNNYSAVDLQSLYEHGSVSFAVKGDRGSESFNLSMYNPVSDASTAAVPLSQFVSVDENWRRVSVPLKLMASSPEQLSAINSLNFSNQTGSSLTVWLSDLYIDTESERYVYKYNPVSVNIKVGEALTLPQNVRALYNDGTSASLPVTWNNAGAVRTNEAGTYTVLGSVAGADLTVKASVVVTAVSSGTGSPEADPFDALNPELLVYDGEPIPEPHLPPLHELLANGAGGVYVVDSPETTVSRGIVTVTLEEADAAKALERLRQQAPRQTQTLVVQAPAGRQAYGYAFTLPSSLFAAGNGALQLALRTPQADVTLTANMFAGHNLAGAKSITIGIHAVDADDIPKGGYTEARTGNHPIFDIFVQVDGNTFPWRNEQSPAAIAINYELTDEEWNDTARLVVLYVDESGHAEPVANSYYDRMRGRVLFTTAHFSTYALHYGVSSFTDLEDDGQTRAAIEALAARGIVKGTATNSFSPASYVTRADFTLMLMRTIGLKADFAANFADVNASSYYYEALGAARQLGIARGAGGNVFHPDAPIARQDMLVLAANALQAAGWIDGNVSHTPVRPYVDQQQIAAYAQEAIDTVSAAGLADAYTDRLDPLAPVTRAEAAVLLDGLYWIGKQD